MARKTIDDLNSLAHYSVETVDSELRRLERIFGPGGEALPVKKLSPQCNCYGARQAAGRTKDGSPLAGFEVVKARADGTCPFCGFACTFQPIGRREGTTSVDRPKSAFVRAKAKRKPKAHLVALWERDNEVPATKGRKR